MFDIAFYQKIFGLKKDLFSGGSFDTAYVSKELEKCRSKEPFVYNIETTNACNMKCIMCPRTTMMTRSIETMDMGIFKNIVQQIRPFSKTEWRKWEEFCKKNYGISRDEMSENHFFLHIIPKVLVLHGYGSPLLDPLMPERIKILSKLGIPSYFSDNPANIDIEKISRIFEKGLNYIKFSIESVDDKTHKNIRGDASNFTQSYDKIIKLLDIKKSRGFKTTIIITMLNLSKETRFGEFAKLNECFKNKDVYVYLKSQDQKWYQKWSIANKQDTASIHWAEYCQFPWSSMTIKSNGEAVMCVEDFNNEIILGDAKKETLRNIWNGENYSTFRKRHIDLKEKMKCTQACDMKLFGNAQLVGGI